ADYLLRLGHRRCAVIAQTPHHAPRIDGFQAALAEAGSASAEAVVERCAEATIRSGSEAAESLLARPRRPTAIFATNDLLAIGAMDAIFDHGLRVPTDLSVVGFDDIALAAQVRPSLTSVALPRQELATKAVELLMRCIDGDIQAAPPPRLCLTPHLVARQSTAPPPAPD